MKLPIPSIFTTYVLQGMDRLADWPTLMQQFQKTLAKSGGDAQASSDRHSSAPLTLLRMIVRNQHDKSSNAIQSNFLYAAMHIACMNDGCSPSESCPDLPGDLNSLVRK